LRIIYTVLIRSISPQFYFRFGTFEEHLFITPSTRAKGSRPLGFDPWPSNDDVGLGSKYTAAFDAVAHANLTGLGLLLVYQVNGPWIRTGKPSALIDVLDLVSSAASIKLIRLGRHRSSLQGSKSSHRLYV
jgi:hypothetical protein